MRTITAPPGIGDSIWLIQKLINTGEKFNFILPDGSPQRGKALFDLLPQVCNSCEYAPGLSYKKIARENIFNTRKEWRKINIDNFYLSANTWLEGGNRIEGFLKDLPTSYNLYFALSEQSIEVKPRTIGLYTSAYKNARHTHYNGWGPEEWYSLCEMLYIEGDEINFAIIGAEYDEDLSQMLMDKFADNKIPCTSFVGQSLETTIRILKNLSYFIGFPSGLSILNEMNSKDGLMFYGTSQKGIINTWANPERIKNGNIKECLFCEPQKIFDWLKNDYKLFDKL